MIDDDFAFVTVLAEYMKRFPERSSAFLDGVDARGLSRRTLVQKLFAHVKKSTAAFAKDPSYQNLIGLHGDEKTGEWRDSRNGIGGGKYPYAVNAALVPAAIKAIAELSANPQSEFYNPSEAIDLEQRFEIWNTKVIPLFEVRVSAARAALLGSEFLTSLGLDPAAFPAPSEDIVFQAISIDKDGKKVRIMHSDDSLMMTFGHPSEAYLKQSAQRFKLGFPYGLVTPVGVLVANPVFASQRLKAQFNETKYHGRVSWKMQEDLLVFGIHRQLERADLTAQTKRELARSEAIIEKVVAARKDEGGTEVFSIVFKNGRFKAVPFDGDAKSNSNQLWSHLRLAFNRLKQAAVR